MADNILTLTSLDDAISGVQQAPARPLSGRRNKSSDDVGGLCERDSAQTRLHQRTASASSLSGSTKTEVVPQSNSLRIGIRRRMTQAGDVVVPPPLMVARSATTGLPYMTYTTGPTTAPAQPGSTAGFPSETDAGLRPRKRSLSVGGENVCRDFFARQVEQYGLQALLGSPVGVCHFLASTIAGFSPENLLFYLEAEHFRTAVFPDAEMRARYARGLYRSFISHAAPLEININHSMRTQVTNVLRSGAPVSQVLFQETQSHTYSLLEQEFAAFRQRPAYDRMLAELTAGRKDAGQRAVAALYDALASTYNVHRLAPGKHRLVASECPAFVKFADMELTSSDLRVALPAWLCRTTVRLLDVAMPESPEEASRLQSADAQQALSFSRPSVSAPAPSPRVHLTRKTSAAAAYGTEKKASKQKSFQRLRTRFQTDAAETEVPRSPPTKPRWVATLLGSRRRKA